MAQPKRESVSVKKANDRAAKLKSVDPALDVGNGNTLGAYSTKIAAVKTMNDDYNTQKAKTDGMLDDVEAAEKELDTMSVNMLSGVRTKYGADSSQYEMAGGTRKSDYKRRAASAKKTTP